MYSLILALTITKTDWLIIALIAGAIVYKMGCNDGDIK